MNFASIAKRRYLMIHVGFGSDLENLVMYILYSISVSSQLKLLFLCVLVINFLNSVNNARGLSLFWEKLLIVDYQTHYWQSYIDSTPVF